MPLFRVTLSHSQDDLALSEPTHVDIKAPSATIALIQALAEVDRFAPHKHLRAHVQRLSETGETAYQGPKEQTALHTCEGGKWCLACAVAGRAIP